MRFAAAAFALLSLAAGAQAGNAPFVANHGQYPAHVRYAATGHPLSPWVSENALWLTVRDDAGRPAAALRIQLTGENAGARVSSTGNPGPAMSFYRGAQPDKWLTRLETRDKLQFSLPPGDGELLLRADNSGIHLRRRGANRSVAVLRVEGAPLEADATGRPQLLLSGKRLPLPISVESGLIAFEGFDDNGAAVRLEPSNTGSSTARDLDGGIAYATYIGSGLSDEAEAVHHHEGDVFIGGHTQGFSFPETPGPLAASRLHVVNAFVARISPSTPADGFVTLFQGSDQLDGEEYVFALQVNDAGETYFGGNTNSEDFPVTPNAYDTRYGGSIDAFIGKLNTDGTLAYATYFGSTEFDSVYGLGLDASGNAYVVGGSWSTDLPTTANAFASQPQGERDAFIAVFDAAGASLSYCSYLGGSSQDQAEAVAVDASGRVHLTGWTRSTDLGPAITTANTTGGRAATSPFDAFAARVDPTGFSTDYAVTLGGTDEDRGDAIALDNMGRAIVAGLTASDDFPVTPAAVDTSYGGGTCSFAPCPDAFLAVLVSNGQSLHYSSYYGGNSWDAGRALAVDAGGAITLAGVTQSPDLPAAGALADASLGGPSDAFIATIDPGTSTLLFATYLGGANEDAANALAIDNAGRVYVSGQTRSMDFPITPDAFASDLSGDYDAFAVVLGTGAADADGDGIADTVDNCILAYNPQQTDSNGDGFGNFCDSDLSGDCAVNFIDLGAMKSVFFSSDVDADLNGDGSVNFLDLGLMKSAFFQAPGPSALATCPP